MWRELGGGEVPGPTAWCILYVMYAVEVWSIPAGFLQPAGRESPDTRTGRVGTSLSSVRPSTTITFTELKLKHCTGLSLRQISQARWAWGPVLGPLWHNQTQKYIILGNTISNSIKSISRHLLILMCNVTYSKRPPSLIMLFWSFLFKTRAEEFHIKPDPCSGLEIGVIWSVIKSSKLHSR